jgi:TetR/AcrR family transcriptional repressor of mexJK operon
MAEVNRERVLRAATDSFLAHGYGSSVDVIARRAGVAKQTVYHHFPSKDELFKEVARDLSRRVLVELEGTPQGLHAALTRFGAAYRKRVLGAQGIATFRALVPEVPRFRALARAMYAASAGETVRRRAAFLEKAMDAGELRRDEPQLAAELLLGMLVGHDRVKRLFGVALAESDARRAERVVECFLRAYRPEKAGAEKP